MRTIFNAEGVQKDVIPYLNKSIKNLEIAYNTLNSSNILSTPPTIDRKFARSFCKRLPRFL